LVDGEEDEGEGDESSTKGGARQRMESGPAAVDRIDREPAKAGAVNRGISSVT
jgi:hypothetical protein